MGDIILSRKWMVLLALLSFLTLAFFISTAVVSVALDRSDDAQKAKPKNVILMISDGFGPASETFARSYFQLKSNASYDYMFPLDQILVGSSRTRASDSLVTDSAAGATAFSCGIKTYNGAIAVDDDKVPCATVLEAARKKGMKTGLVATSRITHATPASFAAHVPDRNMENEIAFQEIENLVDVLLGGGKRHFLPRNQTGSSRTDDIDVTLKAKDAGYQVVLDRAGFDAIPDADPSVLPILGLFHLSDMTYEIDRNPAKEPSLLDMAKKALSLLHEATKNSKEGFFIMIEGSRIDHAGHDNDPAAHLHEILMYQETVEYVRTFLKDHPDTTMISVSDHECGGLTVAIDPDYVWYPEVLEKVTNSSYALANLLRAFKGTPEELQAYVLQVVENALGIHDSTQEELDQIYVAVNASSSTSLIYQLGEMVSKRAHVGWTTHGHTGVDVNLYAEGPGAHRLDGNIENTQIGAWVIDALELKMDEVQLSKKRILASNDLSQDDYHHGH